MKYKKNILKSIELTDKIKTNLERIEQETKIGIQYQWYVANIKMDLEELNKRFERFYRIYKACIKIK